jgi:hypothetical protein
LQQSLTREDAMWLFLCPFLPSSLLSGMEKTEILEVFTIGFCAAQRKVGILWLDR